MLPRVYNLTLEATSHSSNRVYTWNRVSKLYQLSLDIICMLQTCCVTVMTSCSKNMLFHLSLTWWSPQGQRGLGKAGRQWSATDPAVLWLHPQPYYCIHATSASLYHCMTEGGRKTSLAHTTANWHPLQTVILTLPTLASIRNWSVVQVSVVGRCRRRVWLICSRFARIRHSYKSQIWWEGRWGQ